MTSRSQPIAELKPFGFAADDDGAFDGEVPPAGLAVCIREKSLMVEPRLPTESAGDETAAED